MDNRNREMGLLLESLELAAEIRRCDDNVRYFANSKLPKEEARKVIDYFEAAKRKLFLSLLERLEQRH